MRERERERERGYAYVGSSGRKRLNSVQHSLSKKQNYEELSSFYGKEISIVYIPVTTCKGLEPRTICKH